MKIIIVGCGNVGITLAEQLSTEGHNITVIDTREQIVESVYNSYDILGVVGNGTSFNIQMEAGVEDADLLVAVTGSDELNLLCCLIAKKAVDSKCLTFFNIHSLHCFSTNRSSVS